MLDDDQDTLCSIVSRPVVMLLRSGRANSPATEAERNVLWVWVEPG